MAQGANFDCPNCGRRNFVAFGEIKKNMMASVSIDFSCGCRLSPLEVFDELAKIVRWQPGKKHPKFT
jgi:hypothetical protein